MGVSGSSTGAVDPGLVDPLVEDGERLLAALGHPDWELSLLLCDDVFIRPLNRDWRGEDRPTDVLSFPQIEVDKPGVLPPTPSLLGDVVIDVEVAQRQAVERGHDLTTELRVLLVHGLCHLLGHTHDTPTARAAMRALERTLLERLGLDGIGLVERAEG